MQTLLGTLEAMRKAAKAGVYHGVEQRRKNLRALKAEFLRSQKELLSALHEDLGKSEFDGLSTEILMVNDELNCALRNLDGWCAPKKADGGVVNFPSRAYVTAQPLGTVLIYSPWNYPVQLALSPLVGAVAAGNSAVVKPSPLAPATARALARLVGRALPDDLALVTDPSDEVSAALLDEPFDLIFFTGGERFGRHVLECAAKRMTPVVLELGGKSPCIVDASADLDAASKRIVWGKFLNAGQTCVAPDYLLVQKRALAPLCERMERAVKRFYFHAGRLKPDIRGSSTGSISTVSPRFWRADGFSAAGTGTGKGFCWSRLFYCLKLRTYRRWKRRSSAPFCQCCRLTAWMTRFRL